MIESIKDKLWKLLEEQPVSLVMIYNKEGIILWHKGRNIIGKTVIEGDGFCRSIITKSLVSGMEVNKQNQYITFTGEEISESAERLLIRHIIILPVDDFFLYIDGGDKITFNEVELSNFKILAHLLGEAIQQIRMSETDTNGILGVSPAMQKVKDLVLKYSLEEDCILLLGETGVGKSYTAQRIHQYSGRRGKFVTINTPSIPDNLLESEVFGHKKGAFTDAKEDKRGYVDEARGGTLFLDEIANMPVAFQNKLLRFIESKKYMVLGDSVEKEADVRIVAATNKDLHQAIEKKEFSEALYYRLQVLEIEIPPLREREEDLKTMILEMSQFLKGKDIGDGFWPAIENYDWPGNVRELITLLKRVGIHAGNPITGEDVNEVINQSRFKKTTSTQKNMVNNIMSEIAQGKNFWEVVWQPFMDREIDRTAIKAILKDAYKKNKKNFKKMILFLNLKESEYYSFMALMYKYKIDPRV